MASDDAGNRWQDRKDKQSKGKKTGIHWLHETYRYYNAKQT